MPTTPDRPAPGPGQPADPEQARTDAGVASASRDTVPLVRPSVPDDAAHRETVQLDMADRADPAQRDTVRIDPRTGTPDDPAHRETVRLPAQRRPSARRPGRAPLLVAAGFATAWAALLSYLPVTAVLGLAVFLEGAAGSPAAVARLGVAGWLLGHGVPLQTATIGPFGLAPLLLTMLAGWRLARAGVHVTRAIGARRTGSVRAAVLVAVAVAVGYGALGALAAVLARGPGMTVPVPRAALTLGCFGAVMALAGALRCTGVLKVAALRLPPVVRHGLRTGFVAALLVLAAGAGMAGLSLATGAGDAADMIGAYRTGVAGQAGITLVSLAYAPNAAVWAAAYLLGPGFAVGTDTAVRLTDVALGPLPALPLLAGLPDGPVGGVGALLLALPVAAGATAGVLMARRLARAALPGRRGPAAPAAPGWSLLLGSAFLAGPVAGVVLGLAALVSGGPLGAGRLAVTGPVPWQVAVVAAAVLAGAAVAGAAVHRALRRGGRA